MKVRRKIYAAEEDDFDIGGRDDAPMFGDGSDTDAESNDDSTIKDSINSLASNIDDLRDSLEDSIFEDSSSIDIDNNIEDHYIAECEQCRGIFISSVVKSDQTLDKVSGTCPLCEKDTDQYLKWVIIKASDVEG